MKKLAWFLAIVVLAIPFATARASTLQISLTGEITSVDAGLASEFSVGESVSGSFLVDTSVSGTPAGTGTRYFGAVSDLEAHFGDYAATGGSNGDALIFNDVATPTPDSVQYFLSQSSGHTINGDSVNGLSLGGINIGLYDEDGTVFISNAIPLSLILSEFEIKRVFLGFNFNGTPQFVEAVITSISVSPVPLPAALPLFLTILAGMGFLKWRRRRAIAAA